MKNKLYILLAVILTTAASCKKDYLEKPPLDQLGDDSYWTTESNVRTFAYGFYSSYFPGYGTSFSWGKVLWGQPENVSPGVEIAASLNDDYAPNTPTEFPRIVPATGSGWNFENIRKANLFINRVQGMTVGTGMTEEAKQHWIGVGRFFRAMQYHYLVNRFGDVPFYDSVLDETDVAQLYKPRDSRVFVMDKVLEDLKFAAENVRLNDGTAKQTVNKDVVLAFTSRIMLYEGSWQKYHYSNAAKATEYFQAAKAAADVIISSNRYSLGNYRAVFSSLDLSANTEVILFRQYVTGILTHSVMSWNNREVQVGASKSLINSYVASDGLPIQVSPLYQGDQGAAKVFANRDPRMTETFAQEIRLSGLVPNLSSSGYAAHKFLNESLKATTEATGAVNQTDAPVIRLGEILLNYAEATAELGGISNDELNKSINKLRKRPGINLPGLSVSGNQVALENGTVFDDPKRDQTVSPMLWEIRRERRVELVFEGFRWDDIRRWKKAEYVDTEKNIDVNRGAYIKKADYPGLSVSIYLDNDKNKTEGYITPSVSAASARRFTDPKIYLYPLPQDQIVLYKTQGGVELAQNPGW